MAARSTASTASRIARRRMGSRTGSPAVPRLDATPDTSGANVFVLLMAYAGRARAAPDPLPAQSFSMKTPSASIGSQVL